MKEPANVDKNSAADRPVPAFLRGVYYASLAKLMTARDLAYEVPGLLFDARHRVDTCGMVQTPDLDIPEEARPHAVRYQPTKISVFHDMVRRLPIADRQQFAFIDFGSGKGRCLLLAADAGFGRAVGVELSEQLCRVACLNAGRYRSGRYSAIVDVQCTDASAASLPDLPSVFFFYNPFGEPAMSATLRQITSHLDRTRHEAFVIYINPIHSSAVSGSGFELLDSGERRSEKWAIWHRRKLSRRQSA